MPARSTPAERLRRNSVIDAATGCHNWTATTQFKGYAATDMLIDGKRYVRAHRAAYVLAKGPIPEGMQLDHLCRNRRCVNPAHLEIVTLRENVMRGVGPTSINARKTHCKRGHEFTPENTRMSLGKRYCRACAKAQDAIRGTRPKGPKYYAEHPNVRRPMSIGAAS